MFGLCALPSTLSKPFLSAEEDSLFHRGHPAPSCAAFAGPQGLLFFLCLSFARLPYLILTQRENWSFSHPGFSYPWIRPQLPHTAPTGRGTRFSGVASLPWPQNRKQGHTRAFLFSAQSLSQPFPYGERRACSRIWAIPILLDSPTTAPHGSNRAGNPFRWCRSPTWSQKPHTGSHKAKFGFHRLFLVRFFYGREAKSLSSL